MRINARSALNLLGLLGVRWGNVQTAAAAELRQCVDAMSTLCWHCVEERRVRPGAIGWATGPIDRGAVVDGDGGQPSKNGADKLPVIRPTAASQPKRLVLKKSADVVVLHYGSGLVSAPEQTCSRRELELDRLSTVSTFPFLNS